MEIVVDVELTINSEKDEYPSLIAELTLAAINLKLKEHKINAHVRMTSRPISINKTPKNNKTL